MKQRNGKAKVDCPSIILTNARSVSNKFDELVIYSNNLKPDFIVVSETWFDPECTSNLYNIPTHTLFRNDRSSQGGGIALWTRHEAFEISVPQLIETKSNILCVRIPSFNILLIAIYHPYCGKT